MLCSVECSLVDLIVCILSDKKNDILQKRAKGQVLLDLVFQHLELIEKDYFGLQYAENGVNNATIPTSNVMVTFFF